MIDAVSGGALVDKTPEHARNLIANMAQNTQQFGLRRSGFGKRMDEGQSSMMEAQLANLTAMRRYDPYSATYNEGWRDHPNFRYQNCATPPGFEQQNSRPYNMSQPIHQNPSAEIKTHSMLEQMMKMMADQKKETDGRFQSLESAVKQLQTRASSTDVNLGNLQAQVNNRLPSQPVANPRDNVSAIILRSGKDLRSTLKKVQNSDKEDETEVKKVRFSDIEEENLALPKADLQPSQTAPKEAGKSRLQQPTASYDAANFEQEMRVPELRAQASQNANNQPRSYVPKAPFPQRLRKEKSDDINAEILETFRKIGDLKLDRAMLDLGASINVMPRSIYDKVQLGALQDTGLIIQLADRSNAYPDGVLEDVLVQVNELVFPTDFYVLDMGPNDNSIDVPLLLGRPFLKTARTKIDVHKGKLTMEFDGGIVKFNIFDAMRYPTDINSVFTLDVIDNFVQDVYELGDEDELQSVLAKSIFDIDKHEFIISDSLIDSVCALDSPKLTRFKPILPNLTVTGKQIPSLISPPRLELKELPENLKYIYFGENQTLPLIVSNALTEMQEFKLLRVLREDKEAFGWTLADIRGLSTTLCTHKIALEPDTVPKRDPQRRLNPPMMEVVKIEFLKWLEADVIYPIANSKWVTFRYPSHLRIKRRPLSLAHLELMPSRECPSDCAMHQPRSNECLHNLVLVLRRCIETNLILNFEKCHLMVEKGVVLGHVVSAKGLEVDQAKVEVIKNLPYPSTVKGIRSFLGHVGFYRRFIKNFSQISSSLCALLGKDVAFEFNESCKKSFDELKLKLITAPIIQGPNYALPFEILCDASDRAVGAALGKINGRESYIIRYARELLNPAQCNYTTIEKELYAIVFALEKFRAYLLGVKVFEFDLEIKDKKGKENLEADHLSRLETGILRDDSSDLFPDE
ncbi:uncharacterized protein [Gossypium hirsutum]|uniref:Reverse transcriptase/retrotransposon-derived protein RNase H-like domain-containing protein n=1 Tax=Gossypium hirsutum TaxID=3635 RepID=A0A1U8ITC4_GOSHI|nr:uncharacterized protein LOC107900160 [Gossypium hirsutum]